MRLAWRELPVPVIAAVHGVAFGGGFQIMLGADIRYVHPDTRFAVMEIKWGLVPDVAGTQLMRNLAREDVVRELTYTGRKFNGTEAKQLGFATSVVDDPRAAALETAKEIANKSPDAIRAAKRILNDAVAVDAASGLMAESVEQQKLIGSPNQLEAIMSNLQKRAANYKDPLTRGAPAGRVSKGGQQRCCSPCFEDAALRAAPQDEIRCCY